MAVNGLFRATFAPDSAPVVVNDDPLNWEEINYIAERREAVNGLFAKYLASLDFVGDGYEYLFAAQSSAGICGTVKIKIETRQNAEQSFSELFTGIIYVKDIEIDRQKQIIKATIEDETLEKLIQDRASIRVPIETARTLDNSVVTPLSFTTVSLFDPDSEIQGSYTYSTGCYNVFDMFELALNYITNNQVAFESDFFSSAESSPEIWEIELGLPAVTTLCTMTIVNEHGTYTGSYAVQLGDTEEIVLRTLFDQIQQDWTKSPTGYIYDLLPPYYLYGTSAPFYIRSLQPLTSVTLTGGTVNTTSKTTDINENMAGLYITKGASFWYFGNPTNTSVNVGDFTFSFEELYKSCSDLFDLSFHLYDNAGTPTLKMERTKDFFDSAGAASATLTSLKGIEEEYTLQYKKFSLNIQGDTNAGKEYTTLSGSTVYYEDLSMNSGMSFTVEDDCGEGTINSSPNIIPFTREFAKFWVNQDYNENQQDTLFFVDTFDDSGTIRAQQYPMADFNTLSKTNVDVITCYNGFLSSYKTAQYWLWSMGSSIRFGRLSFDNNYDIQFSKKLMFEVPLSDTQHETISSNLTNKIVISGQNVSSTDVWIDSYTFNPMTGMAQFVCLSE